MDYQNINDRNLYMRWQRGEKLDLTEEQERELAEMIFQEEYWDRVERHYE